jgi:hypothetical protein
MKTLRISILAVITAATVYSCSSEREDEVQPNPTTEKKVDLKPLKREIDNQGATAKGGDTILIEPQKLPGEPIDPTTPTDPSEGGDPKDVPLPPRR